MHQQVIVDINDNRKTHILLNLVKELDFVDNVQTKVIDMPKVKAKQKNGTKKLTLAVGMWKDNNITAEQLRKKAWPVRK
jgi:hypothetical protein